MMTDTNYSVVHKDIKIDNVVVQLIDHQHKKVEMLFRVPYSIDEIGEHTGEIDDQSKRIIGYLIKEGFFPDADKGSEKKMKQYKVSIHFFHSLD